MKEKIRWEYLTKLDEELLKGGVLLSGWYYFIVRESDLTFVNGTYLASIVTAVLGVKTYLRSEYAPNEKKILFDLINDSPIEDNLKTDLHKLRKYRNKWVHIEEPLVDKKLLDYPEKYEKERKEMSYFAVKALRKLIYETQCI